MDPDDVPEKAGAGLHCMNKARLLVGEHVKGLGNLRTRLVLLTFLTSFLLYLFPTLSTNHSGAIALWLVEFD